MIRSSPIQSRPLKLRYSCQHKKTQIPSKTSRPQLVRITTGIFQVNLSFPNRSTHQFLSRSQSKSVEDSSLSLQQSELEMRPYSTVLQSLSDQDLSDEECSSPVEAETAPTAASTIPEDWKDAINRVVPAVVVLRVTACRSFDTEGTGSYSATGFVVDKLRGLILTNRHVVKPGPVVAQAIFVNHEEITVYPLYRDPVHDFGFFRFDPGAIKHLEYEEIPLAPEAAHVGLEIRVVGNDSCEKVSILAGTLARMDRGAPTYKKDGYNDFNTFYMQAASGTKGGSSGSPVINRQGWAVALNAGSNRNSSSAFYLPLDRVVRTLKYLQKSRDLHMDKWQAVHIPRGTLQVTFRHEGFDETRRLGLQSETEKMVRRASSLDETGMLVVDSAVPGGPACNLLEPGDVLVRVNGEVTTRFLKLETVLDDNVDQKIELQIERGGTALTINIVVQDLHSITPDYFLEISGTVMHPLSYQQARNFGFQCGLVYVANPGYMLQRAGVPRHAIIKKFASVETPRIEQVISALSKLFRGSRVPLEYITPKDRHQWKAALVTIDRHEWFDAPKIYTRDDSSGIWIPRLAIQTESLQGSTTFNHGEQVLESHTSSIGDETTVVENIHQIDASAYAHSREENIVKTSMQQVEGQLSANGMVVNEWLSTKFGQANLEDSSSKEHADSNDIAGTLVVATNASLAECSVESCLVLVEANVPPSFLLDGVDSQRSAGTGVILYHSHDMGLVAVDKNTVKVSASDIMLSFVAFPIEIPGEVVFLHPVHNYALVCYNPSALGTVSFSKVRHAELLPERPLCRGDSVLLVCLTRYLRAKSRKSTVTNACVTLKNAEVIELDSDFGNKFTGVLCNKRGMIQALWGSFSTEQKIRGKDNQFVRGIPICVVTQILEKIVSGAKGKPLLINGVKRTMPFVRVLEVQLYPELLSKARSYGLTDDWIQALAEKDPLRQQVLRVKSCLAGSKADNILKAGDMLLAVNKKLVTCYRDIENSCQAIEECSDSDGKLSITVFRQGCEVDLLVGTDVRDGNGTTRVINWCGCLVQYPHPAVRALGFLPEEGHGVYVTMFHRGSPADRYGLRANRWIVEVNGKRTPDLDVLVNVTKELGYEEFVRVKTVDLDGKPSVLTLKQDLHYWPTWELRFDPDTAMWRRKTIKALDHSNLRSNYA